jgi:hypothetical protein
VLVAASCHSAFAKDGQVVREAAPLSETFASCILVMDDNHRLIEWLAYHYHTMPLRRLIVMADPRSKTSPLPVLNRWEKYMKIDLWSDDDLFTKEELKNRTDADMVKIHRSRQRAFNIKCLTILRDEGAKWTLMTDVDEYLRINPRAWDSSERLYQKDIAPIQLNEPGSVIQMLNKVDLNDERLHAQEWKACLPVSRVQLSGSESTDKEVNTMFPKGFAPTILAKDFDTFRWRYSGVDTITARDGVIPGKTLIDVSSIPESEMRRLIGDPHRPIDKLCNGGNVWLNTTETMFVADHILGTLESFAARDDSRFVDRVVNWEQRKTLGGLEHLHDELRTWLSGFAETFGIGESRRLLANVGQLQTLTHDLPRCSINFFGLPRSFKTMALPSIVKNVLVPNARYNCDIVVHYYNIQIEESGRFNRGGELDADAVHALEEVSKVIAANAGKSPPSVIIKGETKEEFEKKYGDLIKGYKTTKDGNTGELKYFPWKDKSYNETGKQIDNIVMQWNSIQSAWGLMEEYRKMHGFEYERVAFLRTDAFYALPIDLFQVDKDTFDYNNRYAVIPAFARYPVNDRMMYGPYEAVKIWATERFQRIELYIDSCETKGYGMHQERYIGNGILPAIREETGYEIVENVDICFYRTRAADNLLITDCSDPRGGAVRGIQEIDQVKLVQDLIHRDCLEVPLDPLGRFIELRCDEFSMKEVSARKLQSGASPNYAPTAIPTAVPTAAPTQAQTAAPTQAQTAAPTSEPTKEPTNNPTSDPTASLSFVPSSKPTSPMIFTSTTTTNILFAKTCKFDEKMVQAVASVLSPLFPKTPKIPSENPTRRRNTTVNFLGHESLCVTPFGRAAGDKINLYFEIVSESTDAATLPSTEEVIDIVTQNAASVATIVSEEIGIEITIEDVSFVANPSASPSLSPAPTLSQKPTLSNKPSNEFIPSSSPTQSSVPTGTPTKSEDRTFKIRSSFKFDDSSRNWCLQAKNVRVNAKFNMRPCYDSRSKQKFYLDKYDQLRLRDHPTYCMRWKKKAVYLGYCPVGTETSKAKFTYEENHQHFIVQKPRNQLLLGISIRNKYEKVRLFKVGGLINDSTKSWSLHFDQQK